MNYIISFPISGENNIINMLNILCTKNNIKYSCCNFYNCCKNIICKKKSLFSSNHDFNLDIKINPNNKYLVVYCNDILIQLENYYKYDVVCNKKKYNNKDLINFFNNNINYYNNFIKKWITTNYSNVLVIDFFDFKFDINNSSRNIFDFFFSDINNKLINYDYFNNLNNEIIISNECFLFSKTYYNDLKNNIYTNPNLKNLISNLYNNYYNNYSKHIYFTEVLPYFTAIIIEPREHKALSLVLNNFIKNLDKYWTFYIYHGINNEEFINNIIESEFKDYENKITLINLNVENLSFEDYNKTLYNIDFYDRITTEMFLIFQTDSLISNKYSKLIYNFIEYDYVGAPWLNGCIGNGGLSFRKTNKMKEILNNTSYYYIKDNNEELMNEDIFFSNNEEVFFNTEYIKETNDNIDKNNFINNNVYKPSLEEAKFFSVEAIYNNMSFGIHKPWLYLNNNELESIKNLFPELDLLYTLQ
jgi:hypothetical protein